MKDAVVICVQRTSGAWLAIRRPDHDTSGGQVGFVAGMVEPGERSRDTVKREALEEVGLSVTPVNQITVIELPERRLRLHVWLAVAGASELTPDPAEVAEVLWLSAPDLAVHPDAMSAVPQISRMLPVTAPVKTCGICHGAGEAPCHTGEHPLVWCRCRVFAEQP